MYVYIYIYTYCTFVILGSMLEEDRPFLDFVVIKSLTVPNRCTDQSPFSPTQRKSLAGSLPPWNGVQLVRYEGFPVWTKLVGGVYPVPLKYMSSSVGMIIPTGWWLTYPSERYESQLG